MQFFLEKLKNKILTSPEAAAPSKEMDERIALGVLLYEVARADHKFLPKEKDAVIKVLQDYTDLSQDDIPYIMQAVEEAAAEKIDLYAFTREISQHLAYDQKRPLIEHLFQVACADGELDHQENEIIRKISGLCGLDHKDLVASKTKVKQQFGIENLE